VRGARRDQARQQARFDHADAAGGQRDLPDHLDGEVDPGELRDAQRQVERPRRGAEAEQVGEPVRGGRGEGERPVPRGDVAGGGEGVEQRRQASLVDLPRPRWTAGHEPGPQRGGDQCGGRGSRAEVQQPAGDVQQGEPGEGQQAGEHHDRRRGRAVGAARAELAEGVGGRHRRAGGEADRDGGAAVGQRERPAPGQPDAEGDEQPALLPGEHGHRGEFGERAGQQPAGVGAAQCGEDVRRRGQLVAQGQDRDRTHGGGPQDLQHALDHRPTPIHLVMNSAPVIAGKSTCAELRWA
jgi:hypothetical protein